MHATWVLVIIAAAFTVAHASLGTKQNYGIRGKLMCGGAPLANAQIVLYDQDIGSDQIMDQGRTSADGSFLLSGEASDGLPSIDDIDPWFKIYHRCNKPVLQVCDTKVKFELPQLAKYFTKGNFFEFGTLNMEIKMPNHETDCSH